MDECRRMGDSRQECPKDFDRYNQAAGFCEIFGEAI